MRIGIVVGSIREGRKGLVVGQWVRDHAAQLPHVDVELIDLKELDVPLLTSATVPMAANKQYEDSRVQAWSAAVDACDGFIFVTAEYNHSVPGAFKNAVDSLGPEWVGKPVAFVGYGADGAIRAVEHWRTALNNFQMVPVRAQIGLSIMTEWSDAGFVPADRREGELDTLLTQLLDAAQRCRD